MFAFRALHSVGGCRSPCVSNEELQVRATRPYLEQSWWTAGPGSLGLLAGRADTFPCSRSPPLHFKNPERPLSRPSSASWPPPHGSRALLGMSSNLEILVSSCSGSRNKWPQRDPGGVAASVHRFQCHQGSQQYLATAYRLDCKTTSSFCDTDPENLLAPIPLGTQGLKREAS